MVSPKTTGQPFPRRESGQKATGKARYTDDLSIPGEVHGAVLRSPHALAKVLNIDLSEAEQVPGVLGFLTPEDVPRTLFNCAGSPPSPLLIKDERVLTDRPLMVGDRIAAVAAETKEAGQLALEKIRVEYAVEKPNFSIKRALAEGAAQLHPQTAPGNIVKTITAAQGDVEAGLARAGLVLEEEYHTPAVQHVALEPTACVCDFSSGDELIIQATTQTPFQDRRILAELVGLDESRIRIIKPVMGGGFGARQQLHNQHVGALLSKMVNRPVRMVHTREEEMSATVTRHETLIKVRAGVTREGKLTAFDVEVFFNAGAYASHTPVVAAAAARKFQYRVDHYRYQGHSVLTNAPVAGAMRGYGNPQVTFARESMLDRIATELDLDPVKFRLMNHIKVGDNLPASPITILSCGIKECAGEAGRIKAEIEAEIEADTAKPVDGVKQAWGVAFGCHTSGPSSKEGMSGAVILANDDGTIRLLTGSADIGQGSETALAQVAAEILGLRLDEVAIVAADTGRTPYDTGTFASSQMYVAGNAVKAAAEDLLEELGSALARRHEVDPAKVRWESGGFTVTTTDGRERLGFKEAVQRVSFHPRGAVLSGRAGFKAEESPPPFAVCWARVEVDTRVNTIRVLDLIQAVDAGNPINPGIIKGQVEGGLAMGLGYALMENLEIDSRARKPISSDLLHYRTPTSLDASKMHVIIIDGFEPSGPLGAKSVGELSTVPVAPAITNAVTKALGRPITRLPLSREFMPSSFRLGGSALGEGD